MPSFNTTGGPHGPGYALHWVMTVCRQRHDEHAGPSRHEHTPTARPSESPVWTWEVFLVEDGHRGGDDGAGRHALQ